MLGCFEHRGAGPLGAEASRFDYGEVDVPGGDHFFGDCFGEPFEGCEWEEGVREGESGVVRGERRTELSSRIECQCWVTKESS